jgi:hypothetical protein
MPWTWPETFTESQSFVGLRLHDSPATKSQKKSRCADFAFRSRCHEVKAAHKQAHSVNYTTLLCSGYDHGLIFCLFYEIGSYFFVFALSMINYGVAKQEK